MSISFIHTVEKRMKAIVDKAISINIDKKHLLSDLGL